ncbi:MAG: DUF6475 domain-containing protein [Patescibacteria group bacterium]|nr:DUF6475 domain-containing protein [Patescibacteria group bacterium]
MVEQDNKRFAVLMATLSEIFDDGKDISEIKMEVYWEALKKFEINKVQKAVSDLINTRVYNSFPKPAEIIEMIHGCQDSLALKAWLRVIGAVESVGGYQSIEFAGDPVIHSTVEAMGGWIKLCDMSGKDVVWKQKEFERLYGILNSQNTTHPKYLCGHIETENGGFYADYTPVPILAGENKKFILECNGDQHNANKRDQPQGESG